LIGCLYSLAASHYSCLNYKRAKTPFSTQLAKKDHSIYTGKNTSDIKFLLVLLGKGVTEMTAGGIMLALYSMDLLELQPTAVAVLEALMKCFIFIYAQACAY
jgi:hypothetical protein